MCSLIDSESIDFSGSGTNASPFTGEVVIDPATGNKLELGDGLLVPRMPYCKVYATADQTRSQGETLRFETEDRDWSGMHDTSDVGNASHYVNILEDGWYTMHSRASVEYNASLDETFLRLQDQDGNYIAQGPKGIITTNGALDEVYEEEWLTTGMIIASSIWFYGVSTVTVQGGGTYGHRTNFTVRKIENA